MKQPQAENLKKQDALSKFRVRALVRPLLLDLFCGAGGAAMGYYHAGFDIVGVDIEPQPRYPFTFHQGDALEFLTEYGHEFDAIHASPPCQRYSVASKSHNGKAVKHPALIPATRQGLKKSQRPWVIENVIGAPLMEPIILCGTISALLHSG